MGYEPEKIETKWQKRWEKAGPPKAEDFSKKEKFYCLVEFPYPSGEGLHIGHAFTFCLMDIFARKKRMEGKNVLYPMGWDAFGLPTENYAIRTGIHPAKATKENTDKFRFQMKQLALSYNWEREINTTDPKYYKWTQWIFIQLFKHGLAYKKEMRINWCPACKIGLANEEVVDGKCERCGEKVSQKMLSQWLLKITKYADCLADELDLVDFPDSVVASQRNWIGRSEGAIIRFPVESQKETIPVFTTRPDTLFGATFFVLAPENPLVAALPNSKFQIPNSKLKEIRQYIEASKEKSELERISETKEKTGVFTGAYVLNPLSGEKIPVYVADFVVTEYGTGAVMGVPGHDQRDWDFAKIHNLEIREVILGGDVGKQAYTGEGKLVNSGEYNGLGWQEAKEKIYNALKKKGLAEKSVQYHIRDWIFSRQHYWGEPIPMIYCPTCAKTGLVWWEAGEGNEFLNSKWNRSLSLPVIALQLNKIQNSELAGWFPVPENELPVKLPQVEKYELTGTGESPLAGIKDFVNAKCPHCKGPAKRETDTMPNWAGSSWYYLAYVFSHKLGIQNSKLKTQKSNEENVFVKYKDLVNYWMPVDVYLGGAEHTTLHLLYSRFWHKFLNDIGIVPGKEPYQKRRVHGVILGEDGQRMSKSRGNIVNPEEIIEKFGVDALRIYLAFIGPYDGVFPWNTQGIKGTKRFCQRIWDFINQQLKEKNKESDDEAKGLINCLIKEVGQDIDNFKFNTATAKFMKFLNEVEGKKVAVNDLKKILIVLAPFAPYLTEELWEQIGEKVSIHNQQWPEYEEKLIKEEKILFIVQVNGKVRDKIEINKDITEKEAKELTLFSERIKKLIKDQKIKKVIFVQNKLINFVV